MKVKRRGLINHIFPGMPDVMRDSGTEKNMTQIWKCEECLKRTGIDRGVCWLEAKSDMAVTPRLCPWPCEAKITSKWVKQD